MNKKYIVKPRKGNFYVAVAETPAEAKEMKRLLIELFKMFWRDETFVIKSGKTIEKYSPIRPSFFTRGIYISTTEIREDIEEARQNQIEWLRRIERMA